MPIPVACQCGQRFAAKDELAGRKVRCPNCGNALAIPAVLPSATGPQAAPWSSQPGFNMPNQMPGTALPTPGTNATWAMQPQRGKKPGIGIGSLIGLICGGVAVIAGVILLVVAIVAAGSSVEGNEKTADNTTGEHSGGNTDSTTDRSAPGKIVDDKFGFRFSVPYGFSRTKPPAGQPDTVYTFTDGPVSQTNPPLAIQIQRLHGTINPNERLSEQDMPRVEGVHVTLGEPVRWKGYDLDVIKSRMSGRQVPLIAYSIQFPLEGEAVQLVVGGSAQREIEILGIMKKSLNGFENTRPLPKSAKPAKDFASKVAIIVGKLVFALLLAAGGTVAIVISVRKLRKSTRKHTRQPGY